MAFESGWFYEKNAQWPGQCLGLEVESVLLETKTKFQDLKVFQSKTWGRVLVLDGVVQLTERDECSYQEMLAHIPLFTRAQPPERVLIVGGGDGGMLREVCKHRSVKEVVMCEIDAGVVEASKRFFPGVAAAFWDPRVRLIIDDAVKYVAECQPGSFDVVIIDSSDPDGPAEGLFCAAFYRSVARALTPGAGVVAAQGECLWIHQDIMKQMYHECGSFFKSKAYASVQVPTYPCGQISLFVAANYETDLRSPRRVPSACALQAIATTGSAGGVVEAEEAPEGKRRRLEAAGPLLRYYTPEMHRAAFALPGFVERMLQ